MPEMVYGYDTLDNLIKKINLYILKGVLLKNTPSLLYNLKDYDHI